MARIAFILLCHANPEGVVQQARQLTAVGDCVSIHLDARAPAADLETIRAGLRDNPQVTYARRRVRCGWGEWSLVEATLRAVEAAVAAFPRATHFYMLSGDCMAIKSARYAHEFLDAADRDHIESFDFFDSGWIRTGLREERLIYRHFVNERRRKRLFYAALDWQKRLGLERAVPADLRVMIGSQWWCLRRRTIEAILDFRRARPDVTRFFRRTWIPDETYFQTMVRHLVPGEEIVDRSPTFLMFSDYGMPVTFYNDHYDLLLSQEALFARKISPEAADLRARLGTLYASGRAHFATSGEGRRLHAYLTGRGRVGRRFAPRFWESEASLGRERELLIVACKKWHVAKRLVGSIKHHTGITGLDYLFDEAATGLPDLGGIESTLEKRTRHRRALMRMLFDYYGTDRMVICLDTGSLDLMRDFVSDRATTRLLEVECRFDDGYLAGHARRVGLAGQETGPEALARLLPTLRYDIRYESERIRDAGFPALGRIREDAGAEVNGAALAEFLSVPPETGRAIAETPELFAD